MKTQQTSRCAPGRVLMATLLLLGCHGSPALPPEELTAAAQSFGGQSDSWRVHLSSPSWPLPFGEPCDLLVEVEPRDGSPAPGDLELRVDAGMPAHGHGTLRRAEILAQGAGRFRIEGLYLHMPGAWTLYLDVGRGGIFERTEVPLEVD